MNSAMNGPYATYRAGDASTLVAMVYNDGVKKLDLITWLMQR
jgi:hypothetical protein